MNWNYLETFLTLSDNLSFSETALVLHTSQPAVSRKIKELEESLGLSLFIRSRQSVVLSEEGARFKAQLKPLVAEIQKVVKGEEERYQKPEGSVRIGSIAEAGQIVMFPHFIKFQKQYPGIQLHIEYESLDKIIDGVRTGVYDFGFVTSYDQGKGINAYKLYQDYGVFVQSASTAFPDYRKRKTYELVGYQEDDVYTKGYLKSHLSQGEYAKISFRTTVNSHRSMVETLQKLDLLAVIPVNSVQKFLNKDQLELISSDEKQRSEIYIIFSETEYREKRKTLFLDHIRRAFKK